MLRAIIILGLSMIGFLTAHGQSDIVVKVHNIKSTKGSLYIALFTEESWLDNPFRGVILPISESLTSDGIIQDVPTGTYAISIFHDENNNGVLDTGSLGIPKEPYACSLGATGFLGPPKFAHAKFHHSQDSQVVELSF